MARIKHVDQFSKEDLPLLLNGTLPAEQRERLKVLLNTDKEIKRSFEVSRDVQSALSNQPKLQPANRVFMRVMEGVRQSESPNRSETEGLARSGGGPSRWLGFASGLALTLSFLLLLWLTIQPGIVLHWDAEQNFSTVVYQIYRADAAHAEDFKLVAKIQGQPAAREYTFTDSLLIPGKTYIYRVESVAQIGMGSALPSAWITSKSTGALASFLALLVSSMIMGFGLVWFVNAWGKIISWRSNSIIVSH